MRSYVLFVGLLSCGAPAPSAPVSPPVDDAAAPDARRAGQLGDPCDPTARDPSTAGCHYLGSTCFSLHTVGYLGALCTAPAAPTSPAEDYCGRCSYACDTEPSVTTACPALGGVCVQFDLAQNATCERLP